MLLRLLVVLAGATSDRAILQHGQQAYTPTPDAEEEVVIIPSALATRSSDAPVLAAMRSTQGHTAQDTSTTTG